MRAALATPAYLSVAWTLMVSYQVFTQTAVTTVVNSICSVFPMMSSWLLTRIDMIVFVYAFAWVFVLSSIIPSLILGKERRVFTQFIVVLALTLTAFVLVDVLRLSYGLDFTNQEWILANPYTSLFNNLYFAVFYLSLPYIFMLAIDWQAKRCKQRERLKKLTDNYVAKAPATSK